VFYVAAESGRLPPGLRNGTVRAGVLVLPKGLEPSVRCTPSFEVSGCRGYLLTSGSRSGAREQAA
jgi:hypothetical protein